MPGPVEESVRAPQEKSLAGEEGRLFLTLGSSVNVAPQG